MKILQIAPIAERVPPKKYGGTERVIAALTNELVHRGHEVTLFATGDSFTKAKLISVFPRSTRESGVKDPHGINEWSLFNIGLAYKNQEKFDIIHDHNFPMSLPAANLATTPVVATLHGPITATTKKILTALDKVNLVTISTSQQKNGRGLNIVGTVHHGLELSRYPFGERSEGYLLYVGRISYDKGLHYAIEVAQFFNMQLIIAAKLDYTDRGYFEEFIQPKLSNGLIKWVGEVTEEERNRLYAGAICLLHPVVWPEPFGLTMIEAMACGCPVVAFNEGSIPEVILPGVSGCVVSDLQEMVESVADIGKIDRHETREYALKNFNSKIMTDRYEAIYRQILKTQNQNSHQGNQPAKKLDVLLETRSRHRT